MLIVMVAGCVLFYTCLMFCIVTLDRQMCRRQTHIGRKVKQLMLHLLKMPRFAKIFIVRSFRGGLSKSGRWGSTVLGFFIYLLNMLRHIWLEFLTCLATEITPLFAGISMFPINACVRVYCLIIEVWIRLINLVKIVCDMPLGLAMIAVNLIRGVWAYAGNWRLQCGCPRNNLKRPQFCSNH